MRQLAPTSKIIVATGNETREPALRAVDLGAYDFYQKPVDVDVLRIIIIRAMRLWELEAENRRFAARAEMVPTEGIICASEAMRKVLRSVERIANANV